MSAKTANKAASTAAATTWAAKKPRTAVPRKPTFNAERRSADLQRGADAFRQLLLRVNVINLEAPADDTDADTTDFPAIVREIAAALASAPAIGSAGREGFMRAFADMLAAHGLGFTVSDPSNWRPIEHTHYAYDKAAKQGAAA